jgi:hypothetical protein
MKQYNDYKGISEAVCTGEIKITPKLERIAKRFGKAVAWLATHPEYIAWFIAQSERRKR